MHAGFYRAFCLVFIFTIHLPNFLLAYFNTKIPIFHLGR